MKEPIYFPEGEEAKGRETFESLRKDTRVKEAWLIDSIHWATKGYWIEFEEPKLGPGDSVIDKFNFTR